MVFCVVTHRAYRVSCRGASGTLGLNDPCLEQASSKQGHGNIALRDVVQEMRDALLMGFGWVWVECPSTWFFLRSYNHLGRDTGIYSRRNRDGLCRHRASIFDYLRDV